MKVGSILRRMADIFDQAMQEPEETSIKDTQLQQVDVSAPSEQESDITPMVSPLQQEHELFKKATGVENNVDQFAQDEEIPIDAPCGSESDELAALINLAGIDTENSPHDYADSIKPISINPRATAAQEYHENKNK